jgi:23S rRNA (cytosine1962-C5)-methyltransferase
MAYKQIKLKKRKEESLLRYHPWVFSGAIEGIDNGIEEGDVVKVFSHEGEYLAIGHYQVGSIAVRVLSFEDIDINEKFYEERIQAAWDVRKSLKLLNAVAENHDSLPNNMFRLIHGEGDNLPGLVVDCYGKTAVVQAHSVGMHMARKIIASALIKVMGEQIRHVYYKSETTLPYKAELGQENGFLFGGSTENIGIENGLKFQVDWLKGQKTGFFIDQRDNRSLLESYSLGRKVLNMFCYTGGFSVYAMRGGAEEVSSVDSSAKAIELTKQNVLLNFPNDDNRHKAYCEDAFKFLDSNTQKYDLIILDPPAFAKHRSAIKNALKGYIRLNNKGIRCIKPGGILFTFSCSQAVSKDQFRQAVFTAAAQTGRKVRILHQLHQPADHPINMYHPEGEYLKGLVLYVE